MNLVNLFTKNESIGGIEINETHLRLVVLEWENKKLLTLKIKKIKEAPLPSGVIQNGHLKKTSEFVSALKDLLKDTNGLQYVIPSLAPNNIYFHSYNFPRTISGSKLEETMELTVGFQLPVDPNASYLDWEKISEDKNEVALATISQPIINKYLEAFRQANLNVVAVEFHPLSFLRTINTKPDTVQLIKQQSPDGVTLSVVEGRDLKFIRFIPKNRIAKTDIAKEQDSVTKFYTATSNTTPKFTEYTNLKPIESFLDNEIVAQNPSQWLIALGAAIRGMVPRSEDDLISLMPVGTEEAYMQQKIKTFSGFWSDFTVALSAFFIVVFIGAWMFMVSLQERSLAEIEILSLSTPKKEFGDTQARIISFNQMIATGVTFAKIIPRWENVIAEIKSKTIPGIIIHNLSLPSPSSTFTIRGVSLDRDSLNAYKESLQSSTMLTNIDLPISNITLGKNIPFVISFSLTHPEELYTTP